MEIRAATVDAGQRRGLRVLLHQQQGSGRAQETAGTRTEAGKVALISGDPIERCARIFQTSIAREERKCAMSISTKLTEYLTDKGVTFEHHVHPTAYTAQRTAESLHVPGKELADRKSTRLNSSHSQISYAVFCLKKKKNHKQQHR